MRYGPGKFETCGNYCLVGQWIYQQSQDNCGEDLGDVDGFGWFYKWSDKIKGYGPFHAILSEDSQGFIYLDFYDSEEKLNNDWEKLEKEYQEFLEETYN